VGVILLPTTSVAVRRPSGQGDPYEADTRQLIVPCTPAHISGPSGTSIDSGGAQEIVDAELFVSECPRLSKLDQVSDLTTGDVWEVVWTRTRQGLGLDHQVAGLRAVSGAANG